MEVTFDKSFSKSLDKINSKLTLAKIEKAIIQCEEASKISDIANLKKMKGYKSYYRIKIGDYRIGIEIENNVIDFVIVSHRKDIYKIFP